MARDRHPITTRPGTRSKARLQARLGQLVSPSRLQL